MLHGCHAEYSSQGFTWGTICQWPCCFSGQASHKQIWDITIRWYFFGYRGAFLLWGGGGGLVVLDDELSGYFSNEFKINSLSTVICGAYFGHISTGLIYLRLHVGIFDDFVPCFDIRILEIH